MAKTIESYTPNKKQLAFHISKAKYRCLLGAFRAGKTIAGVWEGIDLNLRYPGNVGLIARKTYRELKDTTQVTFFQQCPKEFIEKYYSSDEMVKFKNGSKTLFRSLDDPNKVKSLELGWWHIDEANEVIKDFFTMLQSRLSLKSVPETRGFLTTNPPNVDHWIYQYFVKEANENYHLIRANTYDNVENLPPGYIDDLKAKYDENWVKKYLEGEFGFDIRGTPVFYGFKEQMHVVPLSPEEGRPIVRCWDFGFHHPCVIFTQIGMNGRWHILRVLMGTDIYIEDFAVAVQNMSSNWFPGYSFTDYGDPAGKAVNDKGKPTIQTLKNDFGINVITRGSKVALGVEIINKKLNNLINGKPSMLINNDETCRILVEGFNGGYCYNANTDGVIDESPYKDGYYEHPFDALRYGAINLFENKRSNPFSITIQEPKWNFQVRR